MPTAQRSTPGAFRAALARPRHALAYLWSGPPDLSRRLQVEWRLVAIRWVGIAMVGPALAFAGLPAERLPFAYAILLTGAVYNLAILLLLRGRPNPLAVGYVTTVGDALLNSGMMLTFGGGLQSSFAFFLFTIVVATAMRFGYGASLTMVLIFTMLDLAQRRWEERPLDGTFLFRAGFLALTALLASYLRERADRDEAALQERLWELERTYAALAQAHKELLGVDEMKTTILANVSHELRTPLTSIRGFSELLLTYDDPGVQREFLQIINAESERLTRLVNDILDISKIESGSLEWHTTRVDVADLLRTSARVHRPLVEHEGLRFRLELPPDEETLPAVSVDPDRLTQVLDNLVGNALKFTGEGTITLAARRAPGGVEISVSDTGIGIAPEDQERIFEKFQQVGPILTGKPRGSGLGLSIARDIVTYHGGELRVDSQPGQGSVFAVFLPAAAPEPTAAEGPAGADGGQAGASAGAHADGTGGVSHVSDGTRPSPTASGVAAALSGPRGVQPGR